MIKVLAVGAGKEQVYAIKKAKELGLYVVAVDGDVEAEGFKLADESYPIDISEKEKVLEIARVCEIQAILPVPIGYCITTIGYINEHLNLIGPKVFATQTCADKELLKNFFAHNGLNYAEQINTTACNYEECLFKMNYPVIAKPKKGCGSKGIKVLFSIQEVQCYIDEIQDKYGEILIEEFIQGKEYGIDAVIQQGAIKFFNIRSKKITPLPHRQELGYISPADIDFGMDRKIYKYFENVVRLLDIKDSLLNADIIVDVNNNVFIIDMSPRPGGQNIMNRILKYSTENEIILEWIKYSINKEKFKHIEAKHTVGLNYMQVENKLIKRLPNIGKLKESYALEEVHLSLEVGKWLGEIQNGADLNERGFFVIIRDNYEQLKKDSLRVIEYINKVVEDNE